VNSKLIMTKQEIIKLLESKGDEQKELHKKASDIRDSEVGKKVFFRGLIEFSNICENDCDYCGIRKSNQDVQRYIMTKEEIMSCADFSNSAGYGSVVLQSGEIQKESFASFVEDVVTEIRKKYSNMGITLSVGEFDYKTYERFFKAGATRYLLRIETSNNDHYKKLHSEKMSFEKRKECLSNLKKIGYQVGTGIMIESPYQTIENLADDILFMKEIDVDMVGMGPFIPHKDTIFKDSKTGSLDLALNMIAVLRSVMPTINIASATALQAIKSDGREMGLMCGANVIMPQITPTNYRDGFQLYNNKPCLDESANQCMSCILRRVKSAGLVPALNEAGDSRHFKDRTK
jgi:biotin synthase